MKRLLMMIGSLGLAGTVFAIQPATPNVSSFTLTNETACIVPSTGPAGSPVVTPKYLDKVIVGAASATGATLILYNSTWTTTPIISSITLTSAGQYNFSNTAVSGLCYTTTTNSKGVTILYKK